MFDCYPIRPSKDETGLAEWLCPDFFEHEDAGTLEYGDESLDVVSVSSTTDTSSGACSSPHPTGKASTD